MQKNAKFQIRFPKNIIKFKINNLRIKKNKKK